MAGVLCPRNVCKSPSLMPAIRRMVADVCLSVWGDSLLRRQQQH